MSDITEGLNCDTDLTEGLTDTDLTERLNYDTDVTERLTVILFTANGSKIKEKGTYRN
jgi:hypothetical protein